MKVITFEGDTLTAYEDTGAGRGTRWSINPNGLARQLAEFDADMDAPTKTKADQIIEKDRASK